MDILIFVIPIVIVLAVLGFVLYIFLGSRKQLDIEIGETPLLKATTGGRLGWIRLNGPFLSVRIYKRFVVILGLGQKIVLHYDEIERAELKKWLGLIEDRVQIHHHHPQAPETIVLGSLRATEIHELIESQLSATK